MDRKTKATPDLDGEVTAFKQGLQKDRTFAGEIWKLSMAFNRDEWELVQELTGNLVSFIQTVSFTQTNINILFVFLNF